MNQMTHSAVPSATWSTSRQGLCPRISSFLNDPDGGHGHGVVVSVADRPDRRVDAFVEEALGEGHRDVLTGLPA